MLEKLIDLIAAGWDRLSPLEVIDAYQKGGVLRFGIYHRTLEPGLHWKWPLAERVIPVETCVTTHRLQPQTITTKDDVSVVVAGIVKYQINDVREYITKIWDQGDVLNDAVAGAVHDAVSARTYPELTAERPAEGVLKAARGEVNKYGFQLLRFTFTDFGRTKSLRLITRTPNKVAN